jgi:hypothetical protein
MGKEGVLLRCVEAMDFVAEQNGAAAELTMSLGLLEDLSNARDTFGHSAEGDEMTVGVA